jgi:hypothetical protein
MLWKVYFSFAEKLSTFMNEVFNFIRANAMPLMKLQTSLKVAESSIRLRRIKLSAAFVV